MTTNKTILAALIAAALAGAAVAHTGATGIVMERMKAMTQMGDAMKSLTPMMSGAAPYDAEAVKAAAETIAAHSGEAMTELFPEDNANEASYVKEAIWEDWERFAELAASLETYAAGLAAAAGNTPSDPAENDTAALMGGGMDADMGSMMGSEPAMDTGTMMGGGGAPEVPELDALAALPADEVFTLVSDTCSACHTRFRKESR